MESEVASSVATDGTTSARSPMSRSRSEADRATYRVRTLDGGTANASEVVFPIVTQHAAGKFALIGTGFFIAENGVFVTAAHVVTAVLDRLGKAVKPFGLTKCLKPNSKALATWRTSRVRQPSSRVYSRQGSPAHLSVR
jgi:hypothetical protein